MGVPYTDCRAVGELIGIKTFINEFVAYKALGVYIDNEKNFTWYIGQGGNHTMNGRDIHYEGNINHTLFGGILQVT